MRKKELLGLFIVITVAALTLFYRLGSLPEKVSLDEIRFGYHSASLNSAPLTTYYVEFNGYRDNRPTLFYYLNLLSFKFFGFSAFSIRFVSALFGLLTVVTFYFLLKELSGNRAAVIGSTLLALQSKLIALSRWTNEVSMYLFFLALTVLFLLRLIKHPENRRLNIFLVALNLGLMQYTYGSARVFLLLVPFVLVLLLITGRSLLKSAVKLFLVFLFTIVITIYPLLIAYKNLPKGTFDLSKVELSIYSPGATLTDKLWSVRHAAVRTLFMFNIKGSEESCYSYPGSNFLDPVEGVLFWLGLILTFFTLKRKIWLVLIILFGASLTPSFISLVSATPQEVRASGAIIFTTLFTALFLDKIYSLLRSNWLKISLITAIFAYVSIINLQNYYQLQMINKDQCFWYDDGQIKLTLREYYENARKKFIIFNPFF